MGRRYPLAKEASSAKIKFEMKEELEKLTKDLFALIGTEADVVVTKEEDVYKVDINPKDQAGLIIGHKGETLAAIEMFLAMALKKSKEEWVKVVVNVGDWKEKQDDYLKSIADQAAQRARETGEAQPLYNLTPSQRRTIHLYLGESNDIETESMGEGTERYLVIKAKA